MKYVVMKPKAPVDPRLLKFPTEQALIDQLSSVRLGDCRGIMEANDEKSVVRLVRLEPGMADAVAMPVPVAIGNVRRVVLGVIADPMRAVDVEAEIPFEMFVHAIGEDLKDAFLFKKGPSAMFDRRLWKLRPLRPELAEVIDIELRATDLEVPTFTEARLGADHRGRSTLYVEIGGIEMSITLADGQLTVQ